MTFLISVMRLTSASENRPASLRRLEESPLLPPKGISPTIAFCLFFDLYLFITHFWKIAKIHITTISAVSATFFRVAAASILQNLSEI
ncbi:hypothetical protein OLMES_0597 [Oleiphilus messinensis]|uniref:Uncharacterized protein n=1 Tax=Oleiphilus messinensis TaxID=141451 RepID=A0A1Y0I362_9GAMM|nr:hypothetical protein OLMES_0597 [Oleiphilus messinensis]